MSQQPNHYSPEVTPAPMPQAPEQYVAAAPVNAPQPPRQSDGITSENYEAAIKEGAENATLSTVIGFNNVSTLAGLATAGGLAIYAKDYRKFFPALTNFFVGSAIGGTAYAGYKLFTNKANNLKATNELGQAIAQHEAQQGEFAHMQRNGAALEIPPQPELAMEQYQPPRDLEEQIQVMETNNRILEQAKQGMQMLANAEISSDASQEVKQLQTFAQMITAGQEFSSEQQQQITELMDKIANSPQLQQEIEASLKPRRPREEGPTPDTVEKVAPKTAHSNEAPTTQVAQAENHDRVQEAASREMG